MIYNLCVILNRCGDDGCLSLNVERTYTCRDQNRLAPPQRRELACAMVNRDISINAHHAQKRIMRRRK